MKMKLSKDTWLKTKVKSGDKKGKEWKTFKGKDSEDEVMFRKKDAKWYYKLRVRTDDNTCLSYHIYEGIVEDKYQADFDAVNTTKMEKCAKDILKGK